MNTKKSLFFLLFLLLNISLFSQIKIKEINYSSIFEDSLYLNISSKRPIKPLLNDWNVFDPQTPKLKSKVNIPCNFSGTEELVFSNGIIIKSEEIKNHSVKIVFNGINYSSEILFNDVTLHKHFGGEIPFSVNVPNDIIKPNEKNKIKVKINFSLSSNETIPVKQRFLFPANRGGILKEVYLQLIPLLHVSSVKFSNIVSVDRNSAELKAEFDFTNSFKKKKFTGTKLRAELKVTELNGTLVNITVQSIDANSKAGSITAQLNNIKLWDVSNPHNYKAQIIIRNDSTVFDNFSRLVSFYDLKKDNDKFLLNNYLFHFNGTTYFVNDKSDFNLVSIDELKSDLQKIKSLGFNTVRFSKAIVNNYVLKLCSEIGLFAFVELPINSVPNEIVNSNSFIERAEGIAIRYLEQTTKYPSVVAFGVGSSLYYKSNDQIIFVDKIISKLKGKRKILFYASFTELENYQISDLDLIGVELFDSNLEQVNDFIKQNPQIKSKLFISEATYPAYKGSTNGYLNNHSFEAQAKYFEEIINLSRENDLVGFFINSMFDFRGDFSSLSTGYEKDNLYQIGIVREDRIVNTLSSQIISSKLNDGDRVTIPLGSKIDDSPMMYIVIGVILSLLMALLFNSKRKFREDATRALLRPYNFYADIRDHRILSGIHATILMFILSAAMALFLSSLLYYYRNNRFLEEMILSFGSDFVMNLYGYLAWNPIEALIYFFIASIIKVFITAAIIKMASFFIKTRVFFSSIFFMVIWSSLPLAVLLPLILILYRILAADIINLYIIIFILLYFLWLMQRLIKGIYVIFDVRRSAVYFYTFVFLFFIVGSIVLFYQLNYSTFYYLKNTLMQFGVI